MSRDECRETYALKTKRVVVGYGKVGQKSVPEAFLIKVLIKISEAFFDQLQDCDERRPTRKYGTRLRNSYPQIAHDKPPGVGDLFRRIQDTLVFLDIEIKTWEQQVGLDGH